MGNLKHKRPTPFHHSQGFQTDLSNVIVRIMTHKASTQVGFHVKATKQTYSFDLCHACIDAALSTFQPLELLVIWMYQEFMHIHSKGKSVLSVKLPHEHSFMNTGLVLAKSTTNLGLRESATWCYGLPPLAGMAVTMQPTHPNLNLSLICRSYCPHMIQASHTTT